MKRHAAGKLSTDFPRSPGKVLVPGAVPPEGPGHRLQVARPAAADPGRRGRDRREVHRPRRHVEHEDRVLPDVHEGRRSRLRTPSKPSSPTSSRPTARSRASRSARAPARSPKHPIQIVAEATGCATCDAEDIRNTHESPDSRRHHEPPRVRARARRLPPPRDRAEGAPARRARAAHDARLREPGHRPLPGPGDAARRADRAAREGPARDRRLQRAAARDRARSRRRSSSRSPNRRGSRRSSTGSSASTSPGRLVLAAGGKAYPALFAPGQSREDRISAVHYIRFPLGAEGRAALASGAEAALDGGARRLRGPPGARARNRPGARPGPRLALRSGDPDARARRQQRPSTSARARASAGVA